MPQAIKHFSGTVVGQTTQTIYTCPANTIAFVLPAVSFNSSVDYTYMVYNSSSIATNSYYNWAAQGQNVLINYNKYINIFSGNYGAFKTHPDCEYVNSTSMPMFTSTSATESYINQRSLDGNGKITPAMIMGPSHKLSLYVQGLGNKTGYNFTIIEEAGS